MDVAEGTRLVVRVQGNNVQMCCVSVVGCPVVFQVSMAFCGASGQIEIGCPL